MNKKILIVEDEQLLIDALDDKFTKEGFEVLTARNGQEGVESALKNHPNIILMDIIMPVMDGITALKELKSDLWGKDVPVIMLSNLSHVDYIDQAHSLDAGSYLIKTNWSLDDIVKEVNGKIAK